MVDEEREMYVGTEGGRNGGERKRERGKKAWLDRQTEGRMDRWMHQCLQGKHSGGRHALRLRVRLRRRASELELKDMQDFTTNMDICVQWWEAGGGKHIPCRGNSTQKSTETWTVMM